MNNDFYISTDKDKMDINFIHEYLSNQSYWAKGRSLELIKKSIMNSMCFGVFTKDDIQIGFARIVTDYVVFAWMMDVFVAEKHKNQGVGKALIDYIVNHDELKEVNGIGLRTNDAHELYKRFGFENISNSESWMFKKKK